MKCVYHKNVSIGDIEFEKELLQNFKQDGVAVITDVFTLEESNKYMDGIVDCFCKLGTGIDKNNIGETWKDYNLPPQTRPGLFQTTMSNIKPVLDIRAHPNVRKIFEVVYSDFRNKKIKDFIVSGDGINIRPGNIGPYATKRDWPHLDQTFGDIYKCVQGQAVLTNTSASFRASPGSHKLFPEILKDFGIVLKSNWHKFEAEEIEKLKNNQNLKWQIPIIAPKGSFIIWTSSTIHSAKLQDSMELPTELDPYNGWRGVVYVCYRPKEEFTNAQIKKRRKVFEENRLTTHWGTNMFSKKPGSRYIYQNPRHPVIEQLIKNPSLYYDMVEKVVLTDTQKAILGY